jgi:hypothetical protein
MKMAVIAGTKILIVLNGNHMGKITGTISLWGKKHFCCSFQFDKNI